eukprot:CAMPEP_0114240972 /NCGR_PEP_ID=MMETSP0058-20121206/9389_1 /TAXON_ID=36894 /ORGANISM="Pyramimonas parkeae, CCMP726" /LENGTH=98 /DNA_ID=CAMNT_0001353477 /DNA_START=459 /DNA_END=755 /DNA_ORIENTATION=+
MRNGVARCDKGADFADVTPKARVRIYRAVTECSKLKSILSNQQAEYGKSMIDRVIEELLIDDVRLCHVSMITVSHEFSDMSTTIHGFLGFKRNVQDTV